MQFTGCQTLMFGTDYPHHEGHVPAHPGGVIDRIFAGVPAEETALIVGGNAAAHFYGFDARLTDLFTIDYTGGTL